MTRIKTSELTGPALRWAVATAQGIPFTIRHGEHIAFNERDFDPEGPAWEYDLQGWKMWDYFRPDEAWDQGGPIIERHMIDLEHRCGVWTAKAYAYPMVYEEVSRAPLIAAMRCYVASVKGEEIDIPEELV